MTLKHLFILPVFILCVSACTPTEAVHGSLLQEAQLKQLKVGQSSKSDVLQRLGSPTNISPFDPLTWYYIGQDTAKHGILDPKIRQETVTVIQFDKQNELLSNIDSRFNHERTKVPINKNATETKGNKRTWIQKFFGNVGRFNQMPAPQ
jgi:outer membrane protein assembly factor BamE (lipoprotein component of BamABCDE complex)